MDLEGRRVADPQRLAECWVQQARWGQGDPGVIIGVQGDLREEMGDREVQADHRPGVLRVRADLEHPEVPRVSYHTRARPLAHL